MSNTRRSFIRNTALAAGAITASNTFANSLLADYDFDHTKRMKHFGLQLWTLRDELFKGTDVKELIKQLANYGYGHVESFEGPKSMFWGMTNKDFKTFLTDLGMTIHSSHCNLDTEPEKRIAEAAEIGMKYLVYPWEGTDKKIDDYKKLAEEFNKKGAACKKAGIRFAFHNHDYSFRLREGQYGQDVLMQNTDPDLVDFQMDIYWVVAAGQNPEEWCKKYPNRFRLSHVKDRSKQPTSDDGKNSVDLGTGTIAWKKVLKTARENGMQYYMVEQEAYPNGSPLQAANTDAAFMKKLRY
jgi:sugar phosphate isomerase/epimerase